MKHTFNFIIGAAICAALFVTSCKPREYTNEDIFLADDQETLDRILSAENPDGYHVYTLDEFVDKFMTERGDSGYIYRTRSEVFDASGKYYLFSINKLPEDGEGIYIRGRITTDDYGGNFYKAMVIQQYNKETNYKQQALRLSVDIGSASGLYQMGQEIMIRCNGLAIGRYANQPQLCVPSYNDNINAQNASQKVGWAPGRIPNEVFRKATKFIGTPDPAAIHYDTLKISEFFNIKNLVAARKLDAHMVVIKNIHFTGQYENNGSLAACNHYAGSDSIGLPEVDPYADVFGPTTNNIGYPQSRVIANDEVKEVKDGVTKYYTTLVGTSEYAKYAYYWLPEPEFVGTITGVLGFYADNATYATSDKLDGYEWSITPRDIIVIQDINLQNAEGEKWQPIEFITNFLP